MGTETMPGCTGGMEYGLRELQRKSFEVSFDLSGTDYIACKNIGSGTYGIVCSAINSQTGERVAIKKVLNVCENAILARRTYREMKILQHFKHDNIIRIREILAPSDLHFTSLYFVFDLMESDLHQVIRSSQPLTDEHVRYFLYQILRGLKYIHSANVIHRDLKPGNLLVNQDCELKIGDFGMSRTIACSNDDFSHQAPLMTQYVATRWYRAPELLLFRRQYTTDVDTWSVGCIFAEMLARKPIFPGNDLMHQLTLIINVLGSPNEDFVALAHSDRVKDFLRTLEKKDPVAFKMLYPTAHPKALKLLEKMLRWNPHDRISVDDALRDLYLNTYHSLDNEPICTSPLNFDIDEEKVTDIGELRDIMYKEIMAKCREQKNPILEVARSDNENTVENSVGHCVGESICALSNQPTISDIRANTNISECRQSSNNLAFTKPIVTVTHQLADGKVVVTFAANKLHAGKIVKSNASMVADMCNNRSSLRSVQRAKAKSSVVARYQPILPSAVRDVTSTDNQVISASGKTLDAKAILRAAILSGRRKEPVPKTRRGRPKKTVKDPSQEKQPADMFMNLSEEDRNMLVRWNKMQAKTSAASRTTISQVSSMLKQRKLDVVSSKTVQAATGKLTQVDRLDTKVHLPGVEAASRPDCVTSFFTDDNWSQVPAAVQRETVHDTDFSNLTVTTQPAPDDVIVVPDSSDLRLIDECIAGDGAASWSPSEYLSNDDAEVSKTNISKTVSGQTSSIHVTKKNDDSGAAVVRLPVMVESLSLDCFGLSALDYLPTEQFRDALTLADIVGSVDRDTVIDANGGPALWTSCKPSSVWCGQRTSQTSKTSVPLKTTSGHGEFKLFSGSMTTEPSHDAVEPSRDLMESSPQVNEDVSLPSMMQTGSAGSGSGYGVGYDIDALLPSAEIDGMMDTLMSAPWRSISGNIIVNSELDALIDQVLDDNSWIQPSAS